MFFYKNGRAANDVLTFKRRGIRVIANVFLAKILPFKVWVKIFRPKLYLDYLSNATGEICVKEVFKFEEIDESYAKLSTRLGIYSDKLTKQNASKYKSYMDFYDEKSKAVVERYFKKDLEAFGYSFGD